MTGHCPALEARFSFPSGVLYDPADGGLFIADSENHAIRKLTAAGEVVTLAGQGIKGHRDGGKDTALLYEPYGFDLDREGRLWFADWGNESIRILHRNGRVETISGKLPHGFMDGPTSIARFRGLMTVRVGHHGEILIPDNENLRIRVLAP